MTHREEIALLITALAEYHRAELTVAVLTVYVDALEPLAIEDIRKAAGQLTQTSPYMPKVADIATLCGANPDAATIDKLVNLLLWGRPIPESYRAFAALALQQLGGRRRVEDMRPEDRQRRVKELLPGMLLEAQATQCPVPVARDLVSLPAVKRLALTGGDA